MIYSPSQQFATVSRSEIVLRRKWKVRNFKNLSKLILSEFDLFWLLESAAAAVSSAKHVLPVPASPETSIREPAGSPSRLSLRKPGRLNLNCVARWRRIVLLRVLTFLRKVFQSLQDLKFGRLFKKIFKLLLFFLFILPQEPLENIFHPFFSKNRPADSRQKDREFWTWKNWSIWILLFIRFPWSSEAFAWKENNKSET